MLAFLYQARFKKHRWYGKILKTKDPLIFSLGWRRFQSVPLYTIQDHNGRNRHLKYTPEHMHCQAIFWGTAPSLQPCFVYFVSAITTEASASGPSTPQNTGLLCLQDLSSTQKGFRVAATGVVLSQDKSIPVMKKLKLIGYPQKVHKKTAFVKVETVSNTLLWMLYKWMFIWCSSGIGIFHSVRTCSAVHWRWLSLREQRYRQSVVSGVK